MSDYSYGVPRVQGSTDIDESEMTKARWQAPMNCVCGIYILSPYELCVWYIYPDVYVCHVYFHVCSMYVMSDFCYGALCGQDPS